MTFKTRFPARDKARSVPQIALFAAATLLAAALIVMVLGGYNVSLAASKTFTVNTVDDLDDGSCNPQHCSLREAINQSNTNGGPDFIHFDIAGTPPYTISVTSSPLPLITDPVTVDGTTEPDYVDRPIIVLDGSGAPAGSSGLRIASGSTTVTGLVIHSFLRYGIQIETAGGNIIEGNFIGTDATGTVAMGNSSGGVFVNNTSNNTIGGTAGTTPGGPCTGACNLISGNASYGIYIHEANAIHNVVLGNFVGTNLTGTVAIANEGAGVMINHAEGNTVGGTTDAERNVISGNGNSGVFINATGAKNNTIQGNYIGTSADGTAAVGNVKDGITIDNAPSNLIGGTAVDAGNLISGNGEDGVQILNSNATGNVVQGNYIGTNHDTTSAVGNRRSGVFVDDVSQQIIGGDTTQARNIISGNGLNGVHVDGTAVFSVTVQGNYIGTDVNGTAAVPNLASGVLLSSAPRNTVGGTTANERNLISGNGGDGVKISGVPATDNMVIGNYIGTDVNGTAGLGNGASGVLLDGAPGNTVGGTSAGKRNLISSNGTHGVQILNPAATNNTILGNYIGTDVSGTTALGNQQHGVDISGAPQNMIGGTLAGALNLVSGNGSAGVAIFHATAISNTLHGNYIGTDITGTAALGNMGPGVLIDAAAQNTIGGTVTGAGNLISGNAGSGISLRAGATQNLVHGNLIGSDRTGALDLGNAGNGVSLTDSVQNTIGGNSPSKANLISGNDQNGVEIHGGGHNLVQGNKIGTDTTGTLGLANQEAGLRITGSHDNLIGGIDGITATGPCTGVCNLISGNDAQGIHISLAGSQNNLIQGNYIGTNPAGTAALANGGAGLLVHDAQTTIIGGAAGAARNLISGNAEAGVRIEGSLSTGNVVHGNYVGTNAAGTSAVPNGQEGVGLSNEASSNTVVDNLLSGNRTAGLQIAASASNTVQGNKIGTNAAGDAALPNAHQGVKIENAVANSIGGTTTAERNVISGNLQDGLLITGTLATTNAIRGNYIGTNAAGGAALSNSQNGVWIAGGAHSNTIGGTDSGAGNLISGNGQSGVYIQHSETMTNAVQGNLIGIQANGTDRMGNGESGIYINDASNNTIGSDAPGAANVIAFNGGDGVTIYHRAPTTETLHSPAATTVATGNQVQGNSIFENGDLGIDLGTDDGVTPNDPQDPDTGANLLQNYPVLGSATTGMNVYISGTLNSLITTTFRLDFYHSDDCDPSNFGEGASYLGNITATTNISGNLAFDVTLSATLPISSFVSATATDPDGNTSEFSECEILRPAYRIYLPVVVRNYP